MTTSKFTGLMTVGSLSILLAACGGGSSTTTTASTATLTGTVPGTLIEAFCSDGSYYQTHSIQEGTQHPFELDLPIGLACRLVMTTNEGTANRIITAIQLQANGETSGNFALNSALNLGYVPLELDPANVVDSNGDGVVDDPLTQDLGTNSAVTVRQVSNDPMDSDSDDIPNVYEDDDNDGLNNYEDSDDDNDGTPDSSDSDNYDQDSDGIDDEYDSDIDNDGETDNTSSTTTTSPVENYTVTRGRLLASQCAQCHGTNGRSTTSWDSIVGEADEMDEYSVTHIMGAQAIGYTSQEKSDLASYLNNLSGGESDEDSEDGDNESEHDDD